MFAKHTKSAALAGFLTLLLTACGTEEEGGNGDVVVGSNGNFSIEAELRVLEIVPEEDGEPGTLETRTYDAYCDGDELVEDSTDMLQNYLVDDGKLYLWEDEECEAVALSGSSSTIIGKWSATSIMSTATEIPDPYRPEGCDAPGEDDEDDTYEELTDSVFRDVRVSYDISATRVKSSFSGRLCMGKLMGVTFAGTGFGAFELVSSDCASATIENTYNGKRLKITTRFTDGDLKVTLTSSGKSCSMRQPALLYSKTPTCPEPDYSDEEEAFDACIEDLPFYQGMEGELAKRGSASSRLDGVVKRLRSSARGL